MGLRRVGLRSTEQRLRVQVYDQLPARLRTGLKEGKLYFQLSDDGTWADGNMILDELRTAKLR